MTRNPKRKPMPLVPAPVKSRKRARKIVTSFHKLAKEVDDEAARSGCHGEGTSGKRRLRELQQQLEEERQAYQSASLLSVGFHNTSKWITQQLTKMDLRPGKGNPPLKVLEVGAINTRLLDVSWLEVRAIDLKSSHPRIEERDFFALPPATEYDVVASSMVLNCVPTPEGRGKMLMGYHDHLRPGGHLFLMIPLLCLTNSCYTTKESFRKTLELAGFQVRESRDSPRVAFFCATAIRRGPQESTPEGCSFGVEGDRPQERHVIYKGKRIKPGVTEKALESAGVLKEVRQGRGRNSFAVTL